MLIQQRSIVSKMREVILLHNGAWTIYLGCGPLPVTVATRMITFRLGNLYKLPSFTTVTGRWPHPNHNNHLPNFLSRGSEAQAQLSLIQRLGGEDPKVIIYVYKYIYICTYSSLNHGYPGFFTLLIIKRRFSLSKSFPERVIVEISSLMTATGRV